MALLYEKLGESGKAKRHWKRYLQLDGSGPWSEVARRRLTHSEGAEHED